MEREPDRGAPGETGDEPALPIDDVESPPGEGMQVDDV